MSKLAIPDDLSIPAFMRRVAGDNQQLNQKETKMAKIGKKEQALKDSRTSDAKLAKAAKDSGAFALDSNKTAGGDVALPGKGTPPKISDAKVAADLAALTGVVEKKEKPEPKVRVVEKNDPKKVAARKPAAAARKPAGKPAAKAKGVTPAAAKKAPAKPVKAKSGEPWPKPETKQAAMLNMVRRKEGASEKAICAELGWKRCRVTLGRVVKAAGFKLEHKRINDETVYFAK